MKTLIAALILSTSLLGLSFVRDEAPLKAEGRTWKLQHVPVSGARCFRNGLAQSAHVVGGKPDFTLFGATLISDFWQEDDTISCDYEW